MPPSYSAVAITDTTTYIAFIEVDEGIDTEEDHSSENEEIESCFYTKEEVKALLKTKEFSSRAQLAAFYFVYGKEIMP